MSHQTNKPAFTRGQQIGALILLAQIGIAPMVYKAIYVSITWITQ